MGCNRQGGSIANDANDASDASRHVPPETRGGPTREAGQRTGEIERTGSAQPLVAACSLGTVVQHRMSGEGQSILLDPVVDVARTCEVQV